MPCCVVNTGVPPPAVWCTSPPAPVVTCWVGILRRDTVVHRMFRRTVVHPFLRHIFSYSSWLIRHLLMKRGQLLRPKITCGLCQNLFFAHEVSAKLPRAREGKCKEG